MCGCVWLQLPALLPPIAAAAAVAALPLLLF